MPLAPRRARRARRARRSGAGLKVVAQAGVLTFVVTGTVAFAQASGSAPEPSTAETIAAVTDLTERSREVASRSSARAQSLTVVVRGEKTVATTSAATVGAADKARAVEAEVAAEATGAFHDLAIEAAFYAALPTLDLSVWDGPVAMFRPPLDKRWKATGGRWINSGRASFRLAGFPHLRTDAP